VTEGHRHATQPPSSAGSGAPTGPVAAAVGPDPWPAGQPPAPPPAVQPLDLAAAGTLVSLCLIWALGQVAIKVGNEGISPLWQAGLRSLLAALVIGACMAWRGTPLRGAAGQARWRLLIGASFAAEFVCLYLGLGLTTAARATVLLYTAPFFVAAGEHLLRIDRLRPARAAGLALAFAGVALALADRPPGSAAADWRGDLLCLAAGGLWGLTILIIKASPLRGERPERTLLDQLAVSAPLLLGASALLGEPGVHAATPLVWAAFAWQVLVVASFSYLVWFRMVQRHSAAAVSIFTLLTPLFGVALGALLLDEPLTVGLLAAAVLVATGIALVNRR